MSTIAVDIDDTLYSFTGLAREIMADLAVERGDKALERGAYASWDEWRAPVDLLGLDAWLEIIEMSHASDQIVSQPPFQKAAETLWEVAQAGHDLLYISNRAPEAFAPTREWLRRHGFPIHYATTFRTRLICTAEAKAPYIADCQYIIDDRPKTLFEFLADSKWKAEHPDEPRKAFALMAPYNRGMTDIPNLFIAPQQSWSVLRHYLLREGVLNGDRNPTAV